MNSFDLHNPASLQQAIALLDPNDVVVPVGAEPFSSGDIPAGETFAHKFTVPGTYRYVCLKHETERMTGTIIVTQ